MARPADLFPRGLAAAGDRPTRAGSIRSPPAVTGYDGGGLPPAALNLDKSFGQQDRCRLFVRASTKSRMI